MHKQYSQSMTKPPSEKVVIYARFSSHSQREESIDGQLRKCHEYAEENNYVVVGEYIDRALTGKNDNRDDFQRLIKDSDKKNFTVVIVYSLDRFARNRYDSAYYKRLLKKNGIKVVSATQHISSTPEGILLESMLEGLAEYYSENLAQNIKRGLTENAMQCKYSGGIVPLGYRVNAEQKYEIDPVGAKVVREIYEMYADGHSASAVVEYCNQQGYKTSYGKPFSRNSLNSILRNEKYIGIYRVKDVVVEDGIPSIVSKELYDRVQAKRKHNCGRKAKYKANEEYLLSGKLFCGHCGSTMIGESGTGRNGTVYHYYKCLSKKRKADACDKKPEKKDWLETLIVRHTVSTVLTDENIEMIATKAMEIVEKEAADNSMLEHYSASLKDVEKRIGNLLDMMEQGICTDSTKSRLMELESERKDLISLVARESHKKPFLTKERIMYWLESFKYGDADDIDFRRRIIDMLVNSIYVYDTDGGKGRRFVITFNLSNNQTKTVDISSVNVSDIVDSAPPKPTYPNTFFFIDSSAFGCVLQMKDVG